MEGKYLLSHCNAIGRRQAGLSTEQDVEKAVEELNRLLVLNSTAEVLLKNQRG